MTSRGPEEATLRQYLLGGLTEEEQQRIERELLEDDAVFEELVALEDELRYEYAQDGLSPEERQRFEERFLRTEGGSRRLERARALLRGLSGAAPRARLVPRLAFAASLLLAATALAVMFRGSSRPPRVAVGPSPSPSVSPAPGTTTPQVEPSSPALVALALAPGVTREAGGERRASVGGGVAILRLQLSLPAAIPSGPYLAVVRSADGREVWRVDGAAPEPGRPVRLVLDIPAQSLEEGDYELTLSAPGPSGPAEVADYSFGVLRP